MGASSYVQRHDCDVCVRGDALDPIGSDFLLSHQRNRASGKGVEREGERNESELKEQTVIDKRR